MCFICNSRSFPLLAQVPLGAAQNGGRTVVTTSPSRVRGKKSKSRVPPPWFSSGCPSPGPTSSMWPPLRGLLHVASGSRESKPSTSLQGLTPPPRLYLKCPKAPVPKTTTGRTGLNLWNFREGRGGGGRTQSSPQHSPFRDNVYLS